MNMMQKAIIATRGKFDSMSLIDAVYHSNNGYNILYEWVWKSDFSYLKSVQIVLVLKEAIL